MTRKGGDPSAPAPLPASPSASSRAPRSLKPSANHVADRLVRRNREACYRRFRGRLAVPHVHQSGAAVSGEYRHPFGILDALSAQYLRCRMLAFEYYPPCSRHQPLGESRDQTQACVSNRSAFLACSQSCSARHLAPGSAPGPVRFWKQLSNEPLHLSPRFSASAGDKFSASGLI